MPPDWLRPDWPAPAHVRAVCTTRVGGVSASPFDALNLGDHVGDRPADVQANRSVLQAAIGTRPVFLKQVHGSHVAALSPATPDGTTADACSATAPGVACTIMVADCLPVLFTDREGTWVAAAHAGWRGLVGEGGRGVLEAVLESFQALAPIQQAQAAIKNIAPTRQAGDVLAWLGPCIGPQAFEVGAEVRAAFCDMDERAARHFTPQQAPGKFIADLAGLARQRLHALGVTDISGNDGTPSWCTVGNASRFFSHRRDTARLGGSGRFAACVWLDGALGG
ncbi:MULTISPECIES: peptidoglycan editing factor PgeF [unclassified Acidovorax]|uniref:peptidoglycan editing factor PgeF n=1 Tax=unclassified Acidovorax TaxID=2684926 RepID=UPI002883297E|nr:MULTISPECIES: peptidoglycan editing factor PgeF [unclassified Acidovorax]